MAKHPDVAKQSLALAMAWSATGKTGAARQQLDRAAELVPTNTIILKELGSVCLEQGDFAAPLEAAAKPVMINPDNQELLGNLSMSQLLAGDRSKAM